MIVWRLADPRYGRDLSGSGSRLYGSRWNSPGRGVVFCGENISLCVLENLVHLPLAMRGDLPKRVAIKIEIPDEKLIEVRKFPISLRGEKFNLWCRKFGDEWLDSGQSLTLRVPSVVVEQEHNFILNVNHPDMRFVKILDMFPFKFDLRLKK
jgi:RES domain-containing protein